MIKRIVNGIIVDEFHLKMYNRLRKNFPAFSCISDCGQLNPFLNWTLDNYA